MVISRTKFHFQIDIANVGLSNGKKAMYKKDFISEKYAKCK